MDPHALPPDLSLVILCYRSQNFAKEFSGRAIGALEGAEIKNYQLVLVGNYVEGSDDITPQVVRELAESNPRIVACTLAKKGWMGWDMKCGLEMATGKYLAIIDGDGQMEISDVVRIYEKIRSENLDLVKTFRLTRGDGVKRKILSTFFNLMFQTFFPGLHSRDINSKPKILTREAYQKLRLQSDDWFIDAEIMIQARRYNFKVGEIPTQFLGLTGRRSFINLRTVFEFLKNFAVYRVREFRAR